MEYDHNLHDFGPFRLDTSERVLLRSGRRVPLPAKAVSTLIILVRNKGHIVEKDDLMKEVWPNEVVEEGNLAQHIFMLRRAFGETADHPKYIETVPRRGYRFLAVTKEIHDASDPAEADLPSQLVHSVAVLPFVNGLEDPTTEYFADNITESLINSLSHLPQILVRPRSTVFRYKAKEIDAQQAGRELDVHSVVMGKVNLVDRTLMISTELIDVAGGWQVYGKTYSATSNEILEIQEKIAKDITAVLPANPTKTSNKRITGRFTSSPSAHQAYLKGRLCWCKHTREGLEQAVGYFRQAIEFDPGYVLAYAAIVDCYLRLATNYLPPVDSLPSAAVVDQAEGIEDLPLETLASLELRNEWDKKLAEREDRRAIELKTGYPSIHQWNAACEVSASLYLGGFDKLNERRKDTLTQHGPALRSSASNQFQSTNLTPAEEVQICCLVAREQIAVGNFEAACLVLQNWYTIGQWPILDRLSPHSFADLFFTTGWLAGSLASTKQVPKAQKHAEELLNRAIGIWEQLGLKRQSAEGQMELGLCYWREGLFDLARNSLKAALTQLGEEDGELRGRGLINLALNEISAGRLHDALACLSEAAPFLDQAGPSLKASYDSISGITFKKLALAENRHEYFERGLEYYRKALYQFEAIGNYLYVAFTENNYGLLLITLKQLGKAESHIKRARKLYERHSDKVYQAQFDDTQACFYIAAKQFDLAEQVITKSIGTLEESGEEAWLVESLTTQGVLLCRVGSHRKAKRVLQRAWQIAERGGNREGAERALFTLIEEMHDQLEDDERLELRAILERLYVPQHTSANKRRRKCLRLIRVTTF